jgi:hypothetical protein
MEQRVKRRVGRPPGRKAPLRPTVSARVPAADYAKLKADARAAGRTLAEQVFYRWRQADEWERQFGSIRELQAQARETFKQGLPAALISAGYQRVRGMDGSAWFEPGVNPSKFLVGYLDQGVLEELLTLIATRAVKLALEGEKS